MTCSRLAGPRQAGIGHWEQSPKTQVCAADLLNRVLRSVFASWKRLPCEKCAIIPHAAAGGVCFCPEGCLAAQFESSRLRSPVTHCAKYEQRERRERPTQHFYHATSQPIDQLSGEDFLILQASVSSSVDVLFFHHVSPRSALCDRISHRV